MLLEQLHLGLIVLFDNLQLPVLQLNILGGLLFLSKLFDSLGCIVLLNKDLFAHLDVLGEVSDHDEKLSQFCEIHVINQLFIIKEIAAWLGLVL